MSQEWITIENQTDNTLTAFWQEQTWVCRPRARIEIPGRILWKFGNKVKRVSNRFLEPDAIPYPAPEVSQIPQVVPSSPPVSEPTASREEAIKMAEADASAFTGPKFTHLQQKQARETEPPPAKRKRGRPRKNRDNPGG